MHVKFRYTLGDNTPEQDHAVKQWIQEVSPGHLLIKHSADEEISRDHWHALLTISITMHGLRKSFKNKVNVSKDQYAMAELPSDAIQAYQRYMCHSTGKGALVEVVSACGALYTEQFFVDNNNEFWDTQEAFKKAQKKRTNDKNGLIDEVLKICKDDGVDTPLGVATVITQLFTKQKRVFQLHYLKAVQIAVMFQLDHKDTKKYVLQQMVESCVGYYG